jgi:cyclophilin family peptidyl-prolyl cis-trans isomerase
MRLFRTTYALSFMLLNVTVLSAQDETPAKPAPESTVVESAPTATPAPADTPAETTAAPKIDDPQATWTKLLQRRRSIYGELLKLQKDFAAAADSDGKRTIRDAYTDLITEFDIEIYPEMLELAPVVYESNANDLDAGEIVMKQAFNANNFDRSAEISAKLIAAGRETRDVLSMGGVSQFALHNFEEAHTILSKAKEQNRLNPQLESYVDASQEYIELWKTEQEIRAKEAALEGDQALPRAEFETDRGKIVFELFENEAPNSVANFVSLIEGGKYDGVRFHRVIDAFMAQGGDPNTLDEDPSNDGLGGPGYTIKCECYAENARKHFRGSLSMAHAGPDTGGSQFFITHLPTSWLNPRLEPQKGGHTVFGRVIEGMDVAASLKKGDAIRKATVLRKRPHEYKPEVTAETTAFPESPTE